MNTIELQKADELLRSCSDGESAAWNNAVDKFGPLIRWAIKDKILRSFSKIDNNDVDEIFQQAFINLWRSLKAYRIKNPVAIPSFLIIIAQNATTDFFRKKIKFSNLHIELSDDDQIHADGNPRSASHNNRLYNEIEELINILPSKERRIIALELFYNLKHKEISEIMDIPVNTVSTIICRIRRSLAGKLKQRGYDA